jgi:thiamine biosynthesis lipoprotein
MTPEASATFACFGSECAVFVIGSGARRTPQQAVAFVRDRMLDWHRRFSRFDPQSELSRFNADRRTTMPVSPEMACLAAAAVSAARLSGGLVDATLVDEIRAVGYTGDLAAPPALSAALSLAPPRRPAGPCHRSRWRGVSVDLARRTVTRPAGLQLDSGGVAKGLFADLLARDLGTHAAFAVDCAGDIRLGGTACVRRPILVASPFDERTLHRFDRASGGVATSGIGRRSWLDRGGRPAHHLLDPATGRPAYTGVVQVTALAPTALEAEIRTKSALLAGPADAMSWLPDGGVVVHDNGSVQIRPARAEV